MLPRATVDHWLASWLKLTVLYGWLSSLSVSFELGTCHTLAARPEQSPPYEPLCEQLGQLPEHEPLVDAVGPSALKRPWPHQYEKPMADFARAIAWSRLLVDPPPGVVPPPV